MFFCAEGEGNNWTTWVFVALLVVLVAALLIVPMFTNKKRAKQANELHNSLKPGDVIKTIGGVIGTIVEVRQVSPTEKELVIETGVGDNKTTMVFDIQALYQVVSRADAPVNNAAEAPAEQESVADDAAQPAVEETPVAETAVQEAEVKAEEAATVAVETPVTEEVKAEEPVAETAAATTEEAVEKEAPVKKAPARKTATKSAGKSTSAGKSASAGKSTAKKSSDK